VPRGNGENELTTRNSRTALVTGAEGFIGSHLVKFLHAKGWNVVGSYLQDSSNSLHELPNLKFAQCDLRDARRLRQIVEEYTPTHIFHPTSWDPCIFLRPHAI